MKIILLHGDYTTKIAERLTKFIDAAKARQWKIERLDAGILNIREALTLKELFVEKKLYLLENPKKIKKSDLGWLKKEHEKNSSTLVIVNYGLLPKTFISSLPQISKEEIFELPKKIWNFLDSFYPGNSRACLVLFHEVLAKEAIELVYFFLTRHSRDLYLAKIDSGKLKYQNWRVKKLVFQAQKFNKEKIKEVIGLLAKADYEAKTGSADLTTALDFLIATQLV